MPSCHACHRELDQSSLEANRCAHCGAVVRKLSQRTIEDKRSLRDRKTEQHETADPNGDDLASQATRIVRPSDYDVGEPTMELDRSDTAGEPQQPDESAERSGRESGPDRKSPTLGDHSDMTMDFQPPPGDESQEDGEGSSRRSTHTLEKDVTIDLDIAPADAEHLDSQWSGTFELGTRQGQTIKQKETVSGFRSSLPVKSRYIREKRKAAGLPPTSLADVPDYELLDIIGEGGMGVVYAAHQSSIARTVAVKMLKPTAKVREDQRDKFISEAVVTGELDHPNIVPIYDLGANDAGALFYSMKRVRGTPWDKVLNQKSLDENLSILMRVADAVAFAHAGGVIHRDLKPENVMLGDFGEVLVMDWGLARITTEFAHVDAVFQTDSLGGTPAYMAPEMARGPIENINKTSDIYLLGALLYEIIGGQPPHSGRDVMQCLMAASQNRIDPIRYDGELKAIALRAMATLQEDRYQSVKEFQEAIQVYQSHSESLVLTAHANQNLQKARESGDYQLFARALYGFQESLTLWAGNERARALLSETQRDYAQSAFGKGDFDLAASLLDRSQAEHEALLKQIDAARAERDARQRRLRYFKRAVAAMLVVVVATITIAFFRVRAARNEAVRQKDIAQQQRVIAEEQRGEAVQQRTRAEEQTVIANNERDRASQQATIAQTERDNAKHQERIAVQQRGLAEQAKQAEEYEAYVARIGLAAAKINENAYDYALQLLDQSKPEMRNWEWGRLAHLAGLGTASYATDGPVQAVAYAPDGRSIVSGDMAGQVTVRDAGSGDIRFQVPHGPYVMSVAYSPDGSKIASGSSDKTIRILDAASGRVLRTLSGHTDGVLTVRFSPDGSQLLSGSYDNTARLWELAGGETLQEFKGHSWWVWAAEFSPDAARIVTAGQDGKAIVWEKQGAGSGERGATANSVLPVSRYAQLTEFTGHEGAIYSACFSPRGDLVATGGYDGLVMIWKPEEVQPIEIAALLDGQPAAEPTYLRLAGHDKPVRSVAFSPNGLLALSGSDDNSIRIWDAASGEPLKALRGHGRSVRSCVFSPDGERVLSGGEDQSLRIWNVEGYQEVRVLHATVFAGHEDAVLSARFSRDGRQIVTASRDRTASLWDAASGRPLRRFEEGHEFLVSGAVFFPDGRHLATGAGDNSVRIWDLPAGTELATLESTGRIGTLAVSPDGNWLATGSRGTDVKLWNARTGKLAATLPGHTAEIASLAFSPTSDRLASGDDRGHVRIWRSANPEQDRPAANADWAAEHELEGHSSSITALRFTPDGGRLLVASGDRTCGQWDLATGEEIRPLVLRHPEWITSMDVSPDGTLAITTCDDGIARLWRLADAGLVAAMRSPGKAFNAASFSPDGSTAVLTAFEDKQVRLWDLSAARAAASVAGVSDPAAEALAQPDDRPRSGQLQGEPLLEPFLDFNQLGGEVWTAMFAPDGRHVLTMGGNDAQLWNLQSRRPVVRYSPHGAVASAAISPDGRLLATGSWDHSAKIWDAATGRAIRKLDGGHAAPINSVEFSPDGSELLTASDDGTARLWDVASGKPTGVLTGHRARLVAASYSPDATRVLTVSGDKTARIWDRASGRLIATLAGHEWAVLCGQFSPDGQRVITGSEDAAAKIWDAASGRELVTLAGHTAAVTSVAFSPDGARALTGSQDNTAKLWDARPEHRGKEILSLPGHTQEVTSVSFSPDGREVLTGSRDGTAIIWLAKDWRGDEPLQTVGLEE